MDVFDDGTGPALYGAASGMVLRWSGSSWLWANSDEFDNDVLRLCGYDDGSGPALYAAGYFWSLYWSGTPRWHIAKLSAGQWLDVGGGLPTADFSPGIHAMVVFDDGAGPQLYVAGSFSTLPQLNSPKIVRWNGTVWSGVGGGLPGGGLALCSFDDGSGIALFASTVVTGAGGFPVGKLAKFSGGTWLPIGPDFLFNGQGGSASRLLVFDDGSGPALFAGGMFDHVGSVPANSIAKWDGTTWSPLPIQLAPPVQVRDMAIHDDGAGPALHVSYYSWSSVPISRWTGNGWVELGSNPCSPACLQSFDDGQGGGPALYAGGNFTIAGGNVYSVGAARWYGGCTHTIDPMCFGDGTFVTCPCANYGAALHGCGNSASTAGASLGASGSTNPDTLALTSTSEPATSTSIFLQSDAQRPAATPLGDGVLCLGGQIRRLFVKTAATGTAQAPEPGDPSISQRSAALGDPLASGAVRFYQVWYRDSGNYCTAATFSATNGLRVVW